MPIISFGKDFWSGLHAWMRDQLLKEKLISPGDIELMQIIEEPQAIVDAIFDCYEREGFAPTTEERRKTLGI